MPENTNVGFRLNIDCDNAAFGDNNVDREFEIARILRDVADKIELGIRCDTYRNIMDVNGNVVGSFKCSTKDQL